MFLHNWTDGNKLQLTPLLTDSKSCVDPTSKARSKKNTDAIIPTAYVEVLLNKVL